MNSRRITMIIAVVVAVAAGLLTVRYLGSVSRSSTPAVVDMKPVLIANTSIGARQKIVPAMLTKVSKPTTQIEPGALTEPRDAEGDIALVAIHAGSTITDSEIGQPAEIGLTGKLTPGMRAVSIPMDLVKSVSGLVEPGDRVDVMASVVRSNRNPPTRTIIRGALVLAVNDALEPNAQPTTAPGAAGPAGPPAAPAAGPSAPQTVTLEVTPQQANLLTFADLNTTLRLALRSPQESIRSFPAEALEMPTETPAQPQSNNVPPPSKPAPPPAAPLSQAPKGAPPITVIEGDQVVGAPH